MPSKTAPALLAALVMSLAPVSLALTTLAPLARSAEAQEPSQEPAQERIRDRVPEHLQEATEAPEEMEATGEPLDLSTPLPETPLSPALRPAPRTSAAAAWEHKVGIDYTKPDIPAARYQPEGLVTLPDQSTGAAWATLSGPVSLPGWNQTEIEARVDPAQEEGKVGTTLRRSLPISEDVVVTLENGVSVIQSLPHAPQAPRSWASSQALRLDLPSSATSVWVGADISSTDEKWLRSLSAEQKLLGGPVTIKGSIRETAGGDPSKSLTAGFKWTW